MLGSLDGSFKEGEDLGVTSPPHLNDGYRLGLTTTEGECMRESNAILDEPLPPPTSRIDNAAGPLVCIVVTTFNVEDFVERSLQSILHQTYPNFHVLVVDDASTDSTRDKIDQFVQSDHRFQLLHLKHQTAGGCGQATNIGLDSCSKDAEYILIADGDDWMERDALKSLLSEAIRFRSDIVIADFDIFLEQDHSPVCFDGSSLDRFNRTSIELFCDLEFELSYDLDHFGKLPAERLINFITHPKVLRISPVPWRKLYRRSFIERFGLRFPEGDYFFEDNAFHWITVFYARRVIKVDRILFHHRRNRKGQTTESLTMNQPVEVDALKDLENGDISLSDDDNYWKSYFAATQKSGSLANFFWFQGKISAFLMESDSCAQLAVTTFAQAFLDKIHASSYIADENFPELFGKVTRQLNREYSHWKSVMMDSGHEKSVNSTQVHGEDELSIEGTEKVDLSIIMPTKDTLPYLKDLLKKMYTDLTRSNIRFEVFVVDDGSTDGTLPILRKFAAEHSSNFYLLEADSGTSGAGRARNQVIKGLIEGEYVYFADSDDTFDFAALALATHTAKKKGADLLIFPYMLEFIRPQLSEIKGMMKTDEKIWHRVMTEQDLSNIDLKLAALGLINYPWKQLTASSLMRDKGTFFGPTEVQNDVQFHWTSIAAAQHLLFYNRPICTHRIFDSTLRTQLTRVQSSSRMGMLDALGMTQRALALQGAFALEEGGRVFEEYKKFFKSLTKWAEVSLSLRTIAAISRFVLTRTFLKLLLCQEPGPKRITILFYR